jgi:site-specific DNA-cytosine methylase
VSSNIIPSQPSCQDTNMSLKTGFKNIRRSTPTRDQNWPLETQVEEANQDAHQFSCGFRRSNHHIQHSTNSAPIINMPSSTKEYAPRRANSDITPKQGKRYSTTTTQTVVVPNGEEMCWIYRSWKLTMREALREQQFRAIIELGL